MSGAQNMATEYPWSHERKLRIREEEVNPSEISESYKSRKNKKYCKKLKGEHNFEFIKDGKWRLIGLKWDELRCLGCGKQKIEYENRVNN